MVEDFADRRVGLMCYGIVSIGLGLICFLMCLLGFLGALMGGTPMRMAVSSSLFWAGAGAFGIILGIGSIQCRRWGYRLMLVWSGFWLAVGIISLTAVCVTLPALLEKAPSASAKPVMAIFVIGFTGAIYVLLPAAFFFFYRIPSVRLTCEMRDPAPSWTEARPLPILAASGLLLLGGVLMLPNALLLKQPIPMFGSFVTGIPATIIFTVLAVVWIGLGWGYWKLNAAAWWAVLVLFVVGLASAVVTFTPESMIEMYQQMEMPEEVIEEIRSMDFLGSLQWIMLGSAVPFLAFQIYLKRFFKRA